MVGVDATTAMRWALAPPQVDRLAAAICLAAGAALLAADQSGEGVTGEGADPAPFAARLALLLVACAGQTQRRRRPLVALALVGAATGADALLGLRLPVIILVLADVVYAAGAFGSARLGRRLVTAVCLLAVALMTAVTLVAETWRQAVWLDFQIAVILPTPVWWGVSIRQHRDAAAAERERAEAAERLAERAERDRRDAVVAERTRMARDLHDVVAGHISAIALQSEAVLSGTARDGTASAAVLRAVRQNSLAALDEMRTMIDVLRAEAPAGEVPVPRLSAVDRLVASARAAGLRVVASAEVPRGLPVAVDAAAYRILQEALTNAARHARGADTRLTVRPHRGRLVLEVVNGPAAEPPATDGAARGGGAGLPGMRTRAEEAGGTFEAGPSAELGEGGWHVRAVLPG